MTLTTVRTEKETTGVSITAWLVVAAASSLMAKDGVHVELGRPTFSIPKNLSLPSSRGGPPSTSSAIPLTKCVGFVFAVCGLFE